MTMFFKEKLAAWIIYPFVMSLSVVLFFVFRHVGNHSLVPTYTAIVIPSLAILFFEMYTPYKTEWKPVASDWKTDSIFLVAIQMLLPKLLVWLSIHYLITFIDAQHLSIKNLWPQNLPIGIQVIMVILISDFLRYWLHRFSHTFPILWRLHAVHHSVQKLYWLNTSRFHPFEKGLQFIMDVLPFMLLGVSEEVIGLHFVLYAINGFFQHCNINLKYGWLNYVVSSSDLHRWHHSRKPEESNHNYGNNIILWDLLFNSFYLPKNRQVEELGLINPNYPSSFSRQLKTPLFDHYDKVDMPEISIGQLFLNFLFRIKLKQIELSFNSFLKTTNNCDTIQLALLASIVRANEETSFGINYAFKNINDYGGYKGSVPVGDYELLEPYIKEQAKNPIVKSIVNDEIKMFNKTSGTTSNPKYIPVTANTLKALKRSQNFLNLIQYKVRPDYFTGKLAGIVSPAVEGITDDNILFGAASGHFYKTMPAIIRFKYALPYEVFEIKDYESKYYCILLLLLQHKDITYFGSANPTTYLKLIEILNLRKYDLLNDLKNRSLTSVIIGDPGREKIIKDNLRPSRLRIVELDKIFNENNKLTFKELWPYIRLLTTWTSGSCGVALNAVLNLMPLDVKVVDPGYMASEARSTFTFDVNSQSGMLTFHDNFFEFVLRSQWESGEADFLLMHELEARKEYYIFITTQSGLYRYNMNDVVTVTGFVNKAPLIKFSQKGKGVCNITGEKLYESQLISAIDALKLNMIYVQVLADVEACVYTCYLELSGSTDAPIDLAKELDDLLRLSNPEYNDKRSSNRLKGIEVKVLKTGSYEAIKSAAINKGQKDGQYKTILLQYKEQFPYNIEALVS